MAHIFVCVTFVCLVWIYGTAEAKRKVRRALSYCPLQHCGADTSTTELEKWECLGRHLFSATGALDHFVEHDCGGVGWGNSIRGLYNAGAMAAVAGRRLIVTHAAFNRVFLPPNASMSSWDFDTSPSASDRNHFGLRFEMRQYFDFEVHGRSPGRFADWASGIAANGRNTTYTKKILVAGVCGGEREMITTGGCMQHVMPKFLQCATNPLADQFTYVQENMLGIPFFYTLFQRPDPEVMGVALRTIRTRLNLPQLEAGTEPSPGAWGLRTPGYYILALHFRRIPIGFEPLALELNEKRNLEYRMETLRGFWKFAEQAATKAKALAACRKQELLIYFATDDVANLRPVAEEKLSAHGRVIFGLSEDEVGHMSPQWTQKDLEQVDKVESHIRSAAAGAVTANGKMEVEVEVDTNAHGKTVLKINQEISKVQRTPDVMDKHGNMAIVEWWILAHANWLVGHAGTSFSDTAAGVGLGPLGVMERIDIVHGLDHSTTSYRRDWAGDSCKVVGAADPEVARSCPNTPF